MLLRTSTKGICRLGRPAGDIVMRKHLKLALVAAAFLGGATAYSTSASAEDATAATLSDIQQTFGFVPTFMKQLPKAGLAGSWRQLKELEFSEGTALSPKVKALIGLAVVAQNSVRLLHLGRCRRCPPGRRHGRGDRGGRRDRRHRTLLEHHAEWPRGRPPDVQEGTRAGFRQRGGTKVIQAAPNAGPDQRSGPSVREATR